MAYLGLNCFNLVELNAGSRECDYMTYMSLVSIVCPFVYLNHRCSHNTSIMYYMIYDLKLVIVIYY